MSDCVLDENEMARYVRQALEEYFVHLDGEAPACDLYEMVMNCVEKPLIERVLTQVGGNQTRAADMLGINRNTLRKKMAQHGIM
ncbi:MAG: Fis family transcriptional regulator [Gallionellales bacterium CG03_land_8_20_14_0_80_55_15]|nr:MAG: Fis family transcriptional regulator [Gallionellales bacterium CG03_land_8_20_14_0_80_55_15]